MALKMKALVEQTGESKSTILYYIKEGLLPQPSKPKPNVHLYDESSIQIIKFIKYLQQSFSYSISEIKTIFENNKFDFNGSFEMMVSSLELISAGKNSQWYSRSDLLELSKVDEKILDEYIQKGYLFEHPNGFTTKELEIIEIIQRAKNIGFDTSIFDSYASTAKELGNQENIAGTKLLADDSQSHDYRYELLFDIVLTLKPYIFNMHTVASHKANITPKQKENR